MDDEFEHLLASADAAVSEIGAQRPVFDDFDDEVRAGQTMELTATVGALVAAQQDDTNMQLTSVVPPKRAQQTSLLSMIEQMRDDAMYDAETDSEQEGESATTGGGLAATVAFVDDDQSRDMDQTAALAETRIVVKLPQQQQGGTRDLFSSPFAASSASNTMDFTAVVGRGVAAEPAQHNDTTMDFTAVVPPRERRASAPSHGLAALLARDDDETRNVGDADDVTGSVAPSLKDLLELYRRSDATRRQSLCAELCDAVGVDRTCEQQMMQVMEDLDDAAADRVVAATAAVTTAAGVGVGDETAALVNTGRLGTTVRFVDSGSNLTQDLTNGFTTILGRLRELREQYDTEDLTKTREFASTGVIGAMTVALAEETRDDIVLRTSARLAARSPAASLRPSLSAASTPNKPFVVGAADDDDMLTAQEDFTAQSIGSLVDTTAQITAPVELMSPPPAAVEQPPQEPAPEEAEQEEEEQEPEAAVVAESRALQQLQETAAQHGWRLLAATGINQFRLARSGAALRATVGVAVADDDTLTAGEWSVRAVHASDRDAALLCQCWQWHEARAAASGDFAARFAQLNERMRALETLFGDVRAARRKANVNVVGAPDGTVQLAVRVSNAAKRQQWHIAVQVSDVQLYPAAARVAVSAEALVGGGEGSAAFVAKLNEAAAAPTTLGSVMQAVERLW